MTARSQAIATMHSPVQISTTSITAATAVLPSAGTSGGGGSGSGIRVSGKQWKSQKSATNRSQLPKSRQADYGARRAASVARKEVVAQEAAIKADRQSELELRKKRIVDRRERKEERERFEKLQSKMHQKSIDRIKRRAKKTKLVNQ